jgi:hypothetical protein
MLLHLQLAAEMMARHIEKKQPGFCIPLGQTTNSNERLERSDERRTRV